METYGSLMLQLSVWIWKKNNKKNMRRRLSLESNKPFGMPEPDNNLLTGVLVTAQRKPNRISTQMTYDLPVYGSTLLAKKKMQQNI